MTAQWSAEFGSESTTLVPSDAFCAICRVSSVSTLPRTTAQVTRGPISGVLCRILDLLTGLLDLLPGVFDCLVDLLAGAFRRALLLLTGVQADDQDADR